MSHDTIGLGLIGTGYLAKAFTLGYRSAPIVYGPDCGTVDLAALATSRPDKAAEDATALGYRRSYADWRDLIADPAVHIVAINTPNHLHKPMALAAIAAGKHVHCEKPLGLDGAEAEAMTLAAEAAGVRTIVGFNYRQNPATLLAREIVAGGELGEIVSVRATHCEDYMADPEQPLSWRTTRAGAGHGALFDVGSHIICIVQFLLGPIARVSGQLRIVTPTRPVRAGASERGPVENDDEARFMFDMASGAAGFVEASRVALGRKMLLSYEIIGTRGSLSFNQERMSELLLYENAGPAGRRGFKTIPVAAEHPDYGAFGMGPGHGVGFNDQKTIECRRLLEAIANGTAASPDFREAWSVSRVMDAVALSSAERSWVEVPGVL